VLDECAAARGAFALEQLDTQREPWCPLTTTPPTTTATTTPTTNNSSTSGESPAADVNADVANYTADAALQWQAVVDAVTRQVPPSICPPPGGPGESSRGQLKVCVLGSMVCPTVGATAVPTAVPTALVQAAAWCGLAVCSMAGAHAAAAAAVSEAEAAAAAASAAAAAEAARLQVHCSICFDFC
jgi:hypothetical protein